jgi:hypothetical protein
LWICVVSFNRVIPRVSPVIDTNLNRATSTLAVPALATTLFVSSSLMFLAEPMIAKMLLPVLGGSPMVWTTCVAFFQIVLFIGYTYSWASERLLSWQSQLLTYGGVLALSVAVLPFTLKVNAVSPVLAPVASVLLLLIITVGIPFFALSTTAPLLQYWFAGTGHESARDPYFLYIASNLGSLTALLLYPAVVEPQFRLGAQRYGWIAGYCCFIGLTLLCGALIWRGTPTAATRALPTRPAASRLRWARRWKWAALAFVPASLMLAVTTYLSTDIASVPLLWIGPLVLYLLSFVLAFGSGTRFWLAVSSRAFPLFVLPVVMFMAADGWPSLWFVILLHFLTFGVVALRCHSILASDRPPPALLTEFYVWIAFGGVLGGLFNALLAPVVFTTIAEYPILLIAACLVPIAGATDAAPPIKWGRAVLTVAAVMVTTLALLEATHRFTDHLDVRFTALAVPALLCFRVSRRPTLFAMALAAMLIAGSQVDSGYGRLLHAERTFFGVYRVSADQSNTFHMLIHGTTVHGMQAVALSRQNEPLTYYDRSGPFGEIYAQLPDVSDVPEVAVIGLGVGALASYATPNQLWTFYEIDPAVERIARNPRYFTFLQQCGTRCRVILGDARLSLAKTRPNTFGLIVIDAFNSDAIPTHLITSEAISLYESRLIPGGVLALHISNRHLSLGGVLARLALEHRLIMREQQQLVTAAEENRGKRASDWVVLAADHAALGKLAEDARWRTVNVSPSVRPWTDDFSNILSILRLR